VFSTPNAASAGSLRRILGGRCPHTGLEFSGFSTNRHNRLYDSEEMSLVVKAAGFEMELCTSRSYPSGWQGLRAWLFETLVRCNDARISLCSRKQVERGDYIFIRARKKSYVAERYPRVLYLDANEWPDWFKTIREKGSSARVLS
jgi:hypothetical protein